MNWAKSFIFLIFCISSHLAFGQGQGKDIYGQATYSLTEQRLGGSYGNFDAKGFSFHLGKKIQNIGFEAYYTSTKSEENRVFYGQDYLVTVSETVIGGLVRVFFLEYFNIFGGYGANDRTIVVPPGCPFQDEFVLDDTCYGPKLGAGAQYSANQNIDLTAEYMLDRGCNNKRIIQAGLRIFF